ncbi:hypothetical protein Tco_1324817, partial [Tanacetum coccineum]
KNLCLDGSDEKATSKRKIREVRLKDAVSISFDELVAWEKEEAHEGVGYNGVAGEGMGYDGDTVQAVGNDGVGVLEVLSS